MLEESKCNNIRKLYKTLVNLIDGRPPSYQYEGKVLLIHIEYGILISLSSTSKLVQALLNSLVAVVCSFKHLKVALSTFKYLKSASGTSKFWNILELLETLGEWKNCRSTQNWE